MRLDTGIWYEVEVVNDLSNDEWFPYAGDEADRRLTRPEADKIVSSLRSGGIEARTVRVTHSREILL